MHAYLSIILPFNSAEIDWCAKCQCQVVLEQCPSDTDGENASNACMHACAARRGHGRMEHPPSRARKSPSIKEAVSVTMSHALRGARGGITRRMGRQRAAAMAHAPAQPLLCLRLLVLDSPYVSSVHPDAENKGKRRRIAQLCDAHGCGLDADLDAQYCLDSASGSFFCRDKERLHMYRD